MRYKACEIVRVLGSRVLADAQTRHAHLGNGVTKIMYPGYYLVLWPAPLQKQPVAGAPRHLGPFLSRTAAELLVTSAHALALLDLPNPTPCRRPKMDDAQPSGRYPLAFAAPPGVPTAALAALAVLAAL